MTPPNTASSRPRWVASAKSGAALGTGPFQSQRSRENGSAVSGFLEPLRVEWIPSCSIRLIRSRNPLTATPEKPRLVVIGCCVLPKGL